MDIILCLRVYSLIYLSLSSKMAWKKLRTLFLTNIMSVLHNLEYLITVPVYPVCKMVNFSFVKVLAVVNPTFW